MKYIVPEYYKQFRCKCGKCRHSCCEGWLIRISMKEYFQLIGISCSEELRRKLDCALKVCPEPTTEAYAQICADWRGICMLHREDGLCALQVELGESHLPDICKLYPRSTKKLIEGSECCCSNSCEEVVELLMNLKETLQFEETAITMAPEFEENITHEMFGLCRKSIVMIQDRNLSLPDRFAALGNFIYDSDIFSKKPDQLTLAFQLLHDFDEYFEKSGSVSDYCRASQNYFHIEGKDNLSKESLIMITLKYQSAYKHLESILPDWQVVFEQLVVNHMFYNNFPYEDNLANKKDAFLSLVSMYSFLRLNLLGYMADKTNVKVLVDFLAAMFRLIEHSDFEYIAVSLLKEENYPIEDCVPQLLCL